MTRSGSVLPILQSIAFGHPRHRTCPLLRCAGRTPARRPLIHKPPAVAPGLPDWGRPGHKTISLAEWFSVSGIFVAPGRVQILGCLR